MVKKFQVYFIKFPGKEQMFPDTGPPMIVGPYFETAPDNDEFIQDQAMNLADWALEEAPDAFGLPDLTEPDYQGYNDMSIDVSEAIMSTLEGQHKVSGYGTNPRCFWKWTNDVEIVPGVVIRAAYFEYGERMS